VRGEESQGVMRRYFGLSKMPSDLRRPVVTLGMFDGVHRGHQKVIRAAVKWAKSEGGQLVVVTFDRHPRRVIHGRRPSFITSLEHKLALLEALGADVCIILRFTKRLAKKSAEDFVRDVIVKRLHAEGVLLGFDSRFGRGGRGDIELLRGMAKECGFRVRSCGPAKIGGAPVSSTAIREAILAGDIRRASRMLGRPVSIWGAVIRGDGIGHALGFPTANLDVRHEICLPPGIYAVTVERGSRAQDGVAYIGRRPTLAKRGEPQPVSVEAHIIGFRGDLYGQLLHVVFRERLRGDKRFKSLDALRAQIKADIAAASRCRKHR